MHTVHVERRGGVVSESDAWPEGRAFESRPIHDRNACVPGQNTLPLIARVLSDGTLNIVCPFYLVSMSREVKYLVIQI